MRMPLFAAVCAAGLIGTAGLVVVGTSWRSPGEVHARAAVSAASGSVPMSERRRASDTCEGYNLELREAAAIQRRIGHEAEAARLLSMQQPCSAATSPLIRSVM
jgi:hypothetical protein